MPWRLDLGVGCLDPLRDNVVLGQHLNRGLSPAHGQERHDPRPRRQAADPVPVRRPAKPAAQVSFALGRLLDNLGRVAVRVHGHRVLREGVPLDVKVLDGLVDGVLRQLGVDPAGNLGLDGARDGDHDAHVERAKLQAQRARVRVESALGGRVRAAVQICDGRRDGRDVEDQAAGADQLWDKGPAHGHDAKDVGREESLDIVHLEIGGRHHSEEAAITVLVRAGYCRELGTLGLRVVDKNVKLSASDLADFGFAFVDAGSASDVERHGAHAEILEALQHLGAAGCADDMVAC